jgi:hypothetical protein
MKKYYLTDFAKGIITGALVVIFICVSVAVLTHTNKKNREINKYVEKQIEIEKLREDYNNRPADEFLEIPDVRRAADGAAGEFGRKRDKIMERYRSGLVD